MSKLNVPFAKVFFFAKMNFNECFCHNEKNIFSFYLCLVYTCICDHEIDIFDDLRLITTPFSHLTNEKHSNTTSIPFRLKRM